jgi:glycine betaine/proline transport system substrate-binding protein
MQRTAKAEEAMKFHMMRALAGFLIGNAMVLSSSSTIAGQPETKDPIKLPLINSADFDFISTVYGGALKKAGYNVEFATVDYTAHFQGVVTGDFPITTGAWATTPAPVEDALSSGKVEDFGSTGVAVREGWWYPKYVEAVCPGLPNYEALKQPDCVKALATAETAPKARFVNAPADWTTDVDKRAEAFAIDIEIISAGTPVALAAAITGAVDKKEPILAWGYQPYWLSTKYDGAWVEFPKAEDACFTDPAWGTNPNATWDCGYKTGNIGKLANKEFIAKVPYAGSILKKLTLSAEDVGRATEETDVKGRNMQEVADEWLAANAETVDGWLK